MVLQVIKIRWGLMCALTEAFCLGNRACSSCCIQPLCWSSISAYCLLHHNSWWFPPTVSTKSSAGAPVTNTFIQLYLWVFVWVTRPKVVLKVLVDGEQKQRDHSRLVRVRFKTCFHLWSEVGHDLVMAVDLYQCLQYLHHMWSRATDINLLNFDGGDFFDAGTRQYLSFL